MKVIRSKVIGFCFGVANTIDKVEQCIDLARTDGLPCYSIGSIIHNRDVVDRYSKLGVRTIKTPGGVEPGYAVVRAHGIPDCERRDFINAGFKLVDSTCPIVARGAMTLRKAAQNGHKTIIIGVKGHAETIGLQGVEFDGRAVDSFLVCSMEDAARLVEDRILSSEEEVVVVVQTTFNEESFLRIREYLRRNLKNIKFSNSPCEAPHVRIKAALDLALQVDAVIVIGGKSSENTRNLARNVGGSGKPVFCIENSGDLTDDLKARLSRFRTVGVCSGSSTPTNVIKDVEDVLVRL